MAPWKQAMKFFALNVEKLQRLIQRNVIRVLWNFTSNVAKWDIFPEKKNSGFVLHAKLFSAKHFKKFILLIFSFTDTEVEWGQEYIISNELTLLAGFVRDRGSVFRLYNSIADNVIFSTRLNISLKIYRSGIENLNSVYRSTMRFIHVFPISPKTDVIISYSPITRTMILYVYQHLNWIKL